MDKQGLQTALKLRGNYHYLIDGGLGAMSKAAFFQAVTEGVDRKLTDDVINTIAKAEKIPAAYIKAVRAVEASGTGFGSEGRALILYEGHRFHKLTGGKFSASNPKVSYPTWDRTKYPASQNGRWDQVWEAITLDVDAGLQAFSQGLFQIMGENYKVCGFSNPFDFTMAMSLSEDAQIEAFVAFIEGKYVAGKTLLQWLREGNWANFALGYNGTAYKVNAYDTKLAAAAKKYA